VSQRFRSGAPEGPTKKKTITLDEGLVHVLESWAEWNKISFTDLVGRVLQDYRERRINNAPGN